MAASIARGLASRFSRIFVVTRRSFSTTNSCKIRNRSRRAETRYQTEISANDRQTGRTKVMSNDILEGDKLFDDSKVLHKDEYVGPEMSDRYYIPSHIKYETLRQSDSKFGQIVMLAQNRKMRERKHLFLLEGATHILEAINAGVKVVYLFFTKGEQLETFPLDEMVADGTELYKVKMGHMQLWSTLVNASGIMAVCKTPKPGEPLVATDNPLPVTLVCDNIRDPGNLGILLRSAAATGCQHVLLTKGCVDAWEPKVLRAACSAHYYLSLLSNIKWELLANYFPQQFEVYLLDGRAHEDKLEQLDARTRRLLRRYERPEVEEVVETPEGSLVLDRTYKDEQLLEAFSKVSLPINDYFRPDYTKSHAVVIASSDSYGISPEAKKLVFEQHGELLSVPLARGVSSLNPAVGGSLLLFEIMKQHFQKKR